MRQREIEAEAAPALHDLASPTAEVMRAIYSHLTIVQGLPDLQGVYRQIGRALGKMVYLLD
ncbi:hypothetical protein DSTSK_24570 [Desulforhabdus sp. TSK]|nr:hypothetical protein DSTSK_24570 [Desulforhabdus sp. TSK]